MLSYFTDLQGSQTLASDISQKFLLSYFTDLQGSQTGENGNNSFVVLSYFTDLQGSQTMSSPTCLNRGLVTLLIYKVLKRFSLV